MPRIAASSRCTKRRWMINRTRWAVAPIPSNPCCYHKGQSRILWASVSMWSSWPLRPWWLPHEREYEG
jgi:hypothetical protein